MRRKSVSLRKKRIHSPQNKGCGLDIARKADLVFEQIQSLKSNIDEPLSHSAIECLSYSLIACDQMRLGIRSDFSLVSRQRSNSCRKVSKGVAAMLTPYK